MRFIFIVTVLFLMPVFDSGVYAAECDKGAINLQRFSKWDVPGDPWGVAVDPQGYVFVTDPVNNRICRYSLEGDNPICFGSLGLEDGEFYKPNWIAFDPVRGRSML